MADIRNIGFIGIGNMGAPIAANLMRARYDVTAYDIDAARARNFAEKNKAQATEDLAALGKSSDLVITMLPTGREVRDVLLEAQGGALAQNLRAGSFVVDMSSADPVSTRKLGQELAARGIVLVDAPVSGGVLRAVDGTLAVMIGGDPQAIATVKPVIGKMGNRLFEVGALGCGHAMKCLNNFIAGTQLAVALEALTVGKQFGLDPTVMADVINVSSGKSFASETVLKQHVISGTYGSGFALGLLAKDIGIASNLADQIGVNAPIGRFVNAMWNAARDELGPDIDHTKVAPHWERKALRSGSK